MINELTFILFEKKEFKRTTKIIDDLIKCKFDILVLAFFADFEKNLQFENFVNSLVCKKKSIIIIDREFNFKKRQKVILLKKEMLIEDVIHQINTFQPFKNKK